MNCAGWPVDTVVWALGITVIEVNVWVGCALADTVRVAVPTTPLLLAVMVAVPVPFAIATPGDAIEATLESLDDQTTCAVTSCVTGADE